MIETFKIISGYYNVNAEVFFEFDEGGRRGHPKKLFKHRSRSDIRQENRAVARKPRDAAAVLFSLKFADDMFKSSQTSKARLHSSKHTSTKQNLTQNGDSRSFKVTCFGVSGK